MKDSRASLSASTSYPLVNGASKDNKDFPLKRAHSNGDIASSSHPNGKGKAKRSRPMGDSENRNGMLSRIPLPIDAVERQIVQLLVEHPTCIILGETGSGKSTQIPQLCVKAGLCEGGLRVACTQPRRVAAISLATRVASETATPLGDKVGYHVRFENSVSEKTQISYMTDGILLREAMHDPYLKAYSAVLIDEAHERSLHTDILLSVVRLCQKQREANGLPPLKVVIMSATMQSQLFSDFFDKAPCYVIKGRTFPVELFYADSIDPASSDYMFNSIVSVLQIHRQEPISDDILVFLTGREEIELAAKKLKEANKELDSDKQLLPVQLFAAMSSGNQMKAFQPAPDGHRKVILATNIAETSLTIAGVRIVVDSGKVKTKTYTACERIDVLRVHSVSKAQAVQRAGRAGRDAPGKCYRLYPSVHFDAMPESSVPEILRSNLASVLLELYAMGMKKPTKMKYVEQPEAAALCAALQQLKALGAVREGKKKDKQVLTDTGHNMNKFPVEPALAKMLLCAAERDCLEEALTLVACMSSETLFADESGKAERDEVERARKKFTTTEGDHLTMLNVYQAYTHEKNKNKRNLKNWCGENFLSFRNLSTAQKIRKQLKDAAASLDLPMRSCGANRDRLRESLAKGMFLNVCEYDRSEDKYRLVLSPSTLLRIHPSSCLSRSRPSHIIFSELVKTTDLYARDVTLIDSTWCVGEIEMFKKRVE